MILWLLGSGVVVLALGPPLGGLAHDSFTAHMIQHLALIFVAAPILALARPGTLLIAGLAPRLGRRPPRRSVALVVASLATLVGVLYLTHVPAFYDLALTNNAVHILEHGLYLGAGLFFWVTVTQVDPLPYRTGYGVRVAALLALSPCVGLLAAAIGTSNEVLYKEQNSSLGDQASGAALMWIAPMLVILPAALILMLRWARQEERAEQRIPVDVRLTRS